MDQLHDVRRLGSLSMLHDALCRFNRPDCDAYAASVEMQATARALVDDWVVANIPSESIG